MTGKTCLAGGTPAARGRSGTVGESPAAPWSSVRPPCSSVSRC